MQAKLLRVIESREVTRVGAVRPLPVDLRFVAATNSNLQLEATERPESGISGERAAVRTTTPPFTPNPGDVSLAPRQQAAW